MGKFPQLFQTILFQGHRVHLEMRFRLLFLLLGLCTGIMPILAQSDANRSIPLPARLTPAQRWADSVYRQLNMDQRLGQLFMVAAYSGGEKMNRPLIEQLIREQQIGGLIFMQGTPTAQALQTNDYQKMSTVPLLIGMDAEWGLGMRLTGVRDFPRQLMLGAIRDSTLVYTMAAAIANQCKRLGVHIDFAPVLDVNNNPNNPVINFRSFGEDKERVARWGYQYMRGLQEYGIMACAKHFPGHGDTDVDSHKDLPIISKSKEQLDALELYPFKRLIEQGIGAVMVAHLQVPALDSNAQTPTTLSEPTITQLLKEDLGFNGLIFTDALNMQGVAKYFSPGEIDLKAFMAGNDVLLFSQDVASGKAQLKKAIVEGRLTEERIAESVKKILAAKYLAGLHQFVPIDTTRCTEELNQFVSPIRRRVADAAITLIRDPYQVIPTLHKNGVRKTAYVAIGIQTENELIKTLSEQGLGDVFFAPENAKGLKSLLKKLHRYETVLLGVHKLSPYPGKQFGYSALQWETIRAVSSLENCLVLHCGNPYAISNFTEANAVMVAYDDAEETQQSLYRILMGQTNTQGHLPVTVYAKAQYGDGLVSMYNALGEVRDSMLFKQQQRDLVAEHLATTQIQQSESDKPLVCCVNPSVLGIDIKTLDKIDEFINEAISQGAFPGCRILAASNGKVFYDKAFGQLRPDSNETVELNTIYDLASVTKTMATTLAIMKLYDMGKLNIYDELGKYLPSVRGTDKEHLLLADILAHQAGLVAWIPFYKETLDSTKHPLDSLYKSMPGGRYTIKVADKLFLRNDWRDSIWQRILRSPLENKGRYVYSDLDFMFLQKVVEQIAGRGLDQFLASSFFTPLGLKHTAFNAKRNLPKAQIAPTEIDGYFRHQIIQGYVHDMGAAMLGGVSGHAGLFSSANDVAVVYQMLLNGGLYKGKRYLKKSTVDLFTNKYSGISRRGLGFDKPDLTGRSSPCCQQASLKTFGHQGFTGTCVWADPEHDLVFVFLSNRTYPSAENKKINSMNVREKVQGYIYSSMGIVPRR